MSKPMYWFRRNQKVLLAVVGVIVIVGFTVAEPLARMIPGMRGNQNPVVVRTNFVDLRESELHQMVQSRMLLNTFLEAVATTAANRMVMSGQFNIPPEQIRAFILNQMAQSGVYGPEMASDEGAVRLMLLVREAEQQGMNISNEAALEWLQRATADQVTPDQLREIFNQLRTSQRRVFDELRRALLAKTVQQAVMHLSAFQGTPPGLRWDYFQRLHREVQAEVIPLAVSDFVDQTGEPTEAALHELFEKNKNAYERPGQPEPGFRIPAKGKFQGFKAVFDQFASAVEVTDEEIAKFYEDNLDQFPYSGLDDETPTTEPTDAEPATEVNREETQPEAAAGEDQPAGDDASSTEPAPEAAPAESNEPTSPEAPSEPEPNQGGGGDDAGSSEPLENPTEEPGPQFSAELSAELKDPTASAVPEAAATETTAAPETPAATSTAAEPSPDLQLPTDIAAGERPKHDPLWKVSDQIRQRLVRQKVQEKVGAVFDALAAAMDQHAQQLELYEIEKEERQAKSKSTEGLEPPAPLDLKGLAEQHGVEAFETDAISPLDVDAVEIGRTMIDGRPFAATAFDNMALYAPRRAEDLAGDQYLFWKTFSSQATVPTFEEAREDVVHAWRLAEARKLALARAQEMADASNKSNESLKQMFGGDTKYPVQETGFFTWMTEQVMATQMGTPRVQLTRIPEVPNAGQDFMRATFALQPGQAGAALDAPEATAYVIRVVEQRPSQEELMSQFAGARYPEYANVAQIDSQEFVIAWVRNLEAEAGLTWERPPSFDRRR